jgi:hypothetical protein
VEVHSSPASPSFEASIREAGGGRRVRRQLHGEVGHVLDAALDVTLQALRDHRSEPLGDVGPPLAEGRRGLAEDPRERVAQRVAAKGVTPARSS